MNNKKLKAELTEDPLEQDYASMSDVEATASLNALTRTRLRAVSMTELREWAAINARAFKVRAGIDNGTLTDQQRNLCLIADKLLGTDDGNLDPSNAAHITFVNELVSAEVLNADDRDALITKATEHISRATELGLGVVKAGHVERVRA